MANKYFFKGIGVLLILLSQHDQYGFVVGKPSFGAIDFLLLGLGVCLLMGFSGIKRIIPSGVPFRAELFLPFAGIFLVLIGFFFLEYPFWRLYNLPWVAVTLFVVFFALYWLEKKNWTRAKSVGVGLFILLFLFLDAYFLSSIFALFFTIVYSFFFIKSKPKMSSKLSGLWIYPIFLLALLVRIPFINDQISMGYLGQLDFLLQIIEKYPHLPDTTRSNVGVWFEYPPLSYYTIAALYHTGFIPPGFTLFSFGKMVLVFVSSLAVFPLYLFFKKITNTQTALFSSIAFAIFPPLRDYEGGHLSTFFGSLLFFITILLIVYGSANKKTIYFFYAGISNGLLVLSHPFPEVVMIFFILTYFLADFSNVVRNLNFYIKGMLLFFLLSASVGMIWWGGIFERHGLDVLTPNKFRTDFNIASDYCVRANLPYKYFKNDLPSYPLVFVLSFFGILTFVKRTSPGLLAIWSTFLFFALYSNVGLFFITSGERYLQYTTPLLYVACGAGLLFLYEHQLTFKKNKRLVTMLLLGVILLISVYTYFLRIEGYPTKQLEDVNLRAANWIEENTPKKSIIVTDTWAAYRLPYLSKRWVLNGKEGSEFTLHNNQRDAASVFSRLLNESETTSLMNQYGAKYVYFLNSTMEGFPFVGDDDCHGQVPAYIFWKEADIKKFENFFSFKKLYYEESEKYQMSLYECKFCG